MINIIHLSDLHANTHQKIDDDFIKSITRVCQSRLPKDEKVILICSGDLAFSGKKEQYALLDIFFKKLTEIYSEIIISPGNHDLDFESNQDIRNLVLQSVITERKFSDLYIKQCLLPQENFFNFFEEKCTNYEKVHDLCHAFIINDEGNNIAVFSINSSWLSELHDKPGKIIFPENFSESIESFIKEKNTTFNIAVIHHTMNWYSHDLQREFRTFFSNVFDLILTGHEHKEDIYKIEKQDKKSVFVHGGILSIDGKRGDESFNILKIDFKVGNILSNSFKYNKREKIFYETDKQTVTIENKNFSNQQLKQDMIEMLNDPGANYPHPDNTKLVLNDIFIMPDVRQYHRKTKKSTHKEKILSAEKILNHFEGNCIIVGNNKSGKTSLAMHLYEKLIGLNLIPIYIDFSVYSKTSFNFETLITKTFSNQYKTPSTEYCIQHMHEAVVLIIDNFHFGKLKDVQKVELISQSFKKCKKVLLFVNSYMYVEELITLEFLNEKIKNKVLNEAIILELLPFGYKRRRELVSKWINYIGLDSSQTHDNLTISDEINYKLDSIVECSNVPPYPFFLMTALSSYTLNSSDLIQGSYATYYQTLINISLIKINDNPSEIRLYLRFLSELAFFMYDISVTSISQYEFDNFISENFSKKFAFKLEDKKILPLYAVGILGHTNGRIGFKYRYLFYYFVASYLSDNLNNSQFSSKTHVKSLCESVFKEVPSSILMFLIHFTNDEFIIESLGSYSKSVFRKSPEVKMSTDCLEFNKLIADLKEVTLSANTPQEVRNIQASMLDDMVSISPQDFDDTDFDIVEHNPETAPEKFLAEVRKGLKLLELTGLILKTYYADFTGAQKKHIVSEGIKAILRSLSVFYSYFSDGLEKIASEVEESFKNKTGSSYEITLAIQNIIVNITMYMSSEFINYVSLAYGNKNLEQTFYEIFGENESNAYTLLEVAFRIRIHKEIDTNYIIRTKEKLKNNTMAISILQLIVSKHVDLFEQKRTVLQKLEETLKLKSSRTYYEVE